MLFTYILVFLFFIILTIIILYLLSIYVFPRKIEEIQKMIEAGQIKLAIKKLNEILEKDDRNPYAHFLLAEAYAADGNSQYAVVERHQGGNILSCSVAAWLCSPVNGDIACT